MKHFFISLIFILFIYDYSFAQSNTVFPEHYAVLKIEPSKTDSEIKAANSPHLVVYNPSAKQGKLLLFLPGTGGIAVKGPKELFLTAVNQGYHVINLSYINTPAVARICKGQTLIENSDCTEAFRTKRIYGNNKFSLINDESQDAIVNRLAKLLIYLSEHDKKGNWGAYLENGIPIWDQIAVSGQSQGGGMAAFIAKNQLVSRVIDFSGGWDYFAKNEIAKWYFKSSITPANRWYGIYHVKEPMASTILESYKAMAIPDNQIYPLKLEVREGRKAHGEGVRNTRYKPQWIEMFSVGN